MRPRNVFLMLGLFGASACSSILANHDEVKNVTGTVRFFSFEGGFYAIRGDDSVTYDPTNLATVFRRDGLHVKARLRVRKDLGNTHMAGPIVDILELSALDPLGPVALDRNTGW